MGDKRNYSGDLCKDFLIPCKAFFEESDLNETFADTLENQDTQKNVFYKILLLNTKYFSYTTKFVCECLNM